ncbi:MAG: hypothetical protein RL538_849 [Candidatus Parcubacteria bacterium]|jgi:uncharacterized protein YggE
MEPFFSQTYNRVLASAVLAMAVLALASYAILNLKMADSSYPMPTNISVMGEGEVTAVPNVGQFSFSVIAEGATAPEAQEASGTKINDILAYLKEQGIEEKDIKTRDYNLYPRYRYEERVCAFGTYCPPGEQVADGFDVSQTVEVKVRDTAKAGGLIAGVGEKGATNISGLSFIVDDTSGLKSEAREKAIADAKTKAEKLAADLGVKLVRMTSYYENESYYPEPYYAKAEMAADMGGGFGGAEMPVGESSTKVQVNISYEVR